MPPIVTLPEDEAEFKEVKPETSSLVVEAFTNMLFVEETRPLGARISKNLWPDPEATVSKFPVWLTSDWMRSVVEAMPADGDCRTAREVDVESTPTPIAFWMRRVPKRP